METALFRLVTTDGKKVRNDFEFFFTYRYLINDDRNLRAIRVLESHFKSSWKNCGHWNYTRGNLKLAPLCFSATRDESE